MATFTAQSKSTSTWTAGTKSSSTWTAASKPSTSTGFLLMEDGFYLLQETGFKLTLEQSSGTGTSWTALSKS